MLPSQPASPPAGPLLPFAFALAVLSGLAVVLSPGCYVLRPSDGGAQTKFQGLRTVDAADVAVPEGYFIQAVASHLDMPTGVAFDDEGRPCIVESGYAYGEVFATPRLARIERDGTLTTIAEGRNGPWTGVVSDGDAFYVAEGGVLEGGRVLRIDGEGQVTVLIDGLPSVGDHHTNGPVLGPDGSLYFGIGTATNSGVVGDDNVSFGWVERNPGFSDIPGRDVVLRGQNFEDGSGAITGAFSARGQSTAQNQTIPGRTVCTGSLLKIPSEGGEPSLVAWGFRNPFGMAFAPDGTLYVSDNGYDERGSRPVWGSPDVLWRVEQGAWYGWPDFVAGKPVTDETFTAPGEEPLEFLLAEHPQQPPEPVAEFGCHSSADGLDFSHNAEFGHEGQAFVALFGDQVPATGKVLEPVGFKVVRVNVQTGEVEDFAVNRGEQNGPASKIGGGGFERPVAARFTPDGRELYVVDFGALTHPELAAVPHRNTGVLWKITRTDEVLANAAGPVTEEAP